MIECKFEHGNPAQLRHVTVDAIVVKDNTILLTKRADKLVGGGKWAIPGGFMERDETTVQTAAREVHEETGYTIEVQDLLVVMDEPERSPGDDRQNITFVYTASPIKKVGDGDPEEVTEQKWFPLDQLPATEDMAFDHLEIIWKYIETQDTVLAGQTS